jgi:hypothetical protein
MALTRTAAQLETSARSRADQVGSSFRSQATIFEYLSASCRSLASMMCRLDDYWNQSTVLLTTADLAQTTVTTSAWWKVVTMRTLLDDKNVKLRRATVDEVGEEVTPTGWRAGIKPAYRLRGDRVLWVPTPKEIHTVTIEYLPTAIFKNAALSAITQMTTTTDTFDGVFGWEDWVILHTAIKLKSDAEKDIANLRAELAEREAEIVLSATERDAEEPQKIRDTWRQDERDYEDEEIYG